MKVDKELIKHVAELARLRLSEKEAETFAAELKEVLNNFSKIDECKTDDVEPSFQPVLIKNHLREDKIVKSLSQEDALKNAKDTKDGYFKGPKAI